MKTPPRALGCVGMEGIKNEEKGNISLKGDTLYFGLRKGLL
jgi:hypothetical protein